MRTAPVSLVCTAFALAALARTSSLQADDPDLVAHWSFNEGVGNNVHDDTGHGFNATRYGAAWVPGVVGSALEFVDHAIVSGIPSAFDNEFADDGFTVAVWVNWYGPHPQTYSKYSYVLDARSSNPYHGGFILFVSPPGTLVFRLHPSAGPIEQLASDTPLTISTWTHVVATFDENTHTARIYIDGIEAGSATFAEAYADTWANATIGNNRWAAGDGQWAPFNGVIDELRVYKRPFLPPRHDCNSNGIEDECDIACGPPPCNVPGCGLSGDCSLNGIPDECEPDCNANDVPDECDIASGSSLDCTGDGIPDECEADCNSNGQADSCDIAFGFSVDCTSNGIPDECEPDCNGNGITDSRDIAAGTSLDCNGQGNGIPDECEPDCNVNLSVDSCDISAGSSFDCNLNAIPDECDLAAGTSADCTLNAVPDECEVDCNGNGQADICDIAFGTSFDCTGNGVPDECEPDCNGNGQADSCDIAFGFSVDCTSNGIPDECEADCNGNGITDSCDIAAGTSTDCNGNSIPDDCISLEPDCNGNGIPDNCLWLEADCNGTEIPDECDILWEFSADCNTNMVPDECMWLENDCNFNDLPDECDLASGTSADCNENLVPDECDLASGTSADCNENLVPDECDLTGGTSADCNANLYPDECEVDCNGNDFQDDCEVSAGTSPDCNTNGIPDDCDIWLGSGIDGNFNGQLDVCESCPQGFGDADEDGSVTLSDYAALASCLSGPVASADPVCDANDLDGDCHVDLVDFARFQQALADGLPDGVCCVPAETCADGTNWAECVADSGVFQGFGSECATTTCWPLPAIVQIRTLAEHGPFGEFGTVIAPPVLSEPRMSGTPLLLEVTLEVTFSRPMLPSSCTDPYNITVRNAAGQTQPGGITATLDASRMVLRMDISLADQECYIFNMGGMLSSERRPLPLSEREFGVSSLIGDVNGDLIVDGSDTGVITSPPNWQHTVSNSAQARADINTDGAINMADIAVVTNPLHWGKSAPACGW